MAVGYYVNTTSYVAGTSGTPKILYSINWVSDATGGVISIYDGTTTGGVLVYSEKGAASVGTYRQFGGCEGISLNGGIYVSADAHVTSYVIAYKEQI